MGKGKCDRRGILDPKDIKSMKQQITKEQLNELSPIGKDNFAKYITKMPSATWGTVYKDEESLLLSIGEMIEFLKARVDKTLITLIFNQWEHGEIKEPCDALWEAVKKILEK